MKYIQRCGMIVRKGGMSQVFDDKSGVMLPVTFLIVEPNTVIDIFNKKNNYSFSCRVASIKIPMIKLNQADKGQFNKLNSLYYKVVKQFNVKYDTSLAIGDQLDASRYNVGDYLDISSVTIGKGFAGGIKRHNFRGLEASHGVSLKHRGLGSTGQCQDPGKVFKGKKMPGQMGNKAATLQNVVIIDVDKENNLIIVKGSVPGSTNSIAYIEDSVKKPSVTCYEN